MPSVIQTAFHAGEWAPALYARVDLAKYHSAAAFIENWFVDYRGGVSTRPGTKYVLQAYNSTTDVRLIRFQASSTVGYVLEFGNYYIRFHNNGSPVLETGKVITNVTIANPGVITSVAHGFSVGQWIYVSGIVGPTALNSKYFNILAVPTANTFTLTDLFGNVVDTSTFPPYTSGGTAARIYTLPSPYAAADLSILKFAQNVSTMVLCHPSYPAYNLTLISATNWTLSPVVYGTTVLAPTTDRRADHLLRLPLLARPILELWLERILLHGMRSLALLPITCIRPN